MEREIPEEVRRRRLSYKKRDSFYHQSWESSIRRPSHVSPNPRGNWGSKWEFLLSCVGLSVGIGNVWRFPYLAYQNGGGAFLIPYLVMLILAGKPIYFMELAFGQFAGVGPLAIWNCVPIAKGVGWAMVTVSLIVCIYYNVIMSYTMHYFVSSLSSVLPWSVCDPAWADMSTCFVDIADYTNSSRASNGTELQPASQQYWERYVLNISPGIEEMGTVKWDLALCLLASWVIVVLCLVKGIKTSGKVVYFAATFPYVILLTLLVTGLLQKGAMKGVLFFVTPSFEKLLDINVWRAAAGQMFFSLSVSMGGLIMYSSYNDFQNNVYRDAMVVSVLDTATSIISGMVIFSILGAKAEELNIPIDDVVKDGPGLAFIAYPEALLRLPFPQLWTVLFFLMLFILGLDSEFALLENALTSLSDEFDFFRRNKLALTILSALVCYLLGLPCVMNGGAYLLTLMDAYGGGTAIIFIAIAECGAIAYLYGLGKFCDDIEFMLNVRPGWYWKFTWAFCAPCILLFIFVLALIEHKPLKYEDYDYPDWADAVGWGLTLISVINIPLWAIVTVIRMPGENFRELNDIADGHALYNFRWSGNLSICWFTEAAMKVAEMKKISQTWCLFKLALVGFRQVS
ncbi:unnamed protein product [Notodromas monacha]|uniref:Transporter n=1 Tax=Notodromas monacha TaxID=399045 RepID=A0A7R9BGN6_9CRUS|nr:unnamed protein product [Notodromas monacha]CAG0913817.1 unnamed protein product [Notodromas monacha]